MKKADIMMKVVCLRYKKNVQKNNISGEYGYLEIPVRSAGISTGGFKGAQPP